MIAAAAAAAAAARTLLHYRRNRGRDFHRQRRWVKLLAADTGRSARKNDRRRRRGQLLPRRERGKEKYE